MREHHYLGFKQFAGRGLRHVAVWRGHWLALLGWQSGAFKCQPRDRWLGWHPSVQFRRLHLIGNNTRFLVLPEASGIGNLASRALSRSLRRLGSDWEALHGHPLELAETFVDPSRFRGTWAVATSERSLLGRGGVRFVGGFKDMLGSAASDAITRRGTRPSPPSDRPRRSTTVCDRPTTVARRSPPPSRLATKRWPLLAFRTVLRPLATHLPRSSRWLTVCLSPRSPSRAIMHRQTRPRRRPMDRHSTRSPLGPAPASRQAAAVEPRPTAMPCPKPAADVPAPVRLNAERPSVFMDPRPRVASK